MPDCDAERAKHNALRARMLSGGWAQDIEEALARHIRPERRAAWGVAEMSRNPFRSLASQVGGALYESPPELRTAAGSEGLGALIEGAGLWQIQQIGRAHV